MQIPQVGTPYGRVLIERLTMSRTLMEVKSATSLHELIHRDDTPR